MPSRVRLGSEVSGRQNERDQLAGAFIIDLKGGSPQDRVFVLSLMRPGTFIYHSHLDDIHQLTGGLYGPLLVFAEDDTYNPETDHVYVMGWNTPHPASPKDFEINFFVGQALISYIKSKCKERFVAELKPFLYISLNCHDSLCKKQT